MVSPCTASDFFLEKSHQAPLLRIPAFAVLVRTPQVGTEVHARQTFPDVMVPINIGTVLDSLLFLAVADTRYPCTGQLK